MDLYFKWWILYFKMMNLMQTGRILGRWILRWTRAISIIRTLHRVSGQFSMEESWFPIKKSWFAIKKSWFPTEKLKNVDFSSRNPGFLSRNPDFLLKNVDFIIQQWRRPELQPWFMLRTCYYYPFSVNRSK